MIAEDDTREKASRFVRVVNVTDNVADVNFVGQE